MTPGALAIVMVTLWVRRGSSGAVRTKPAILGGRRAMEYEQANRGNVNDCFDPFGTKSSPRRVRMPGSPAVATPAVSVSVFNPVGEVPVSCRQNTALATFETNVLLLRRVPRSSAASEPSAIVRRRHKLGALENMSSACADVPWRVRNRGIGELLANVKGVAIASCV